MNGKAYIFLNIFLFLNILLFYTVVPFVLPLLFSAQSRQMKSRTRVFTSLIGKKEGEKYLVFLYLMVRTLPSGGTVALCCLSYDGSDIGKWNRWLHSGRGWR